MPFAFTRAVSPRIAECALTHLDRQPIDPVRAASQHAAYEQELKDAGYDVVRLPELTDHPDAVFVEDTAILLGDHAIITRPGAASRAGEADSSAQGLKAHFTVHRLSSGTLDGGDVLRVGTKLYVGLSSRTNDEGAAALETVVAPLGFSVVPVRLIHCLHLKTAVTFAGPDRAQSPTILINPAWVSPKLFPEAEPLFVDEPAAANTLRIADRLILPAGNPRTAQRLRDRGFDLVEVDVSELQKAEAGVTCMSLISDR